MSDRYEVYGAPPSGPPDQSDQPWELAAPAVTDVSGQPWQVVIEFTNAGDAKPPMVVLVQPDQYESREEALAAAEQAAFEYRPPDPWSPQGRHVFRDGPDGYLAIIQGATTEFPMTVRIVQLVGETLGQG